jgi:hypothetical protein
VFTLVPKEIPTSTRNGTPYGVYKSLIDAFLESGEASSQVVVEGIKGMSIFCGLNRAKKVNNFTGVHISTRSSKNIIEEVYLVRK